LKYAFAIAPFLIGLAANETTLKGIIKPEDFPALLEYDASLFDKLPFATYLSLVQIEREANLTAVLLENVPDEIRNECLMSDFDKCWITYKLYIDDNLKNIHEYFKEKWPHDKSRQKNNDKFTGIQLPQLKQSLLQLRIYMSDLTGKHPELLGLT
jgi:hypothetical protein